MSSPVATLGSQFRFHSNFERRGSLLCAEFDSGLFKCRTLQLLVTHRQQNIYYP